MKMTKTDVAIVFPSGRKCVREVVAMLANDLEIFGHLDRYKFHLIVSYDPTFYNLSLDDFKIDEASSSRFASVEYLGPESHYNLRELPVFPAVNDEAFDILFKPRGYCSQKNRAIIRALYLNAEHIIFLDDDEYFVAPFKNEESLDWVVQDVVGAHLNHNPQAAITNGAHTGYFSPIPSDLELNLDESIRQKLGEIFSIGNEVIDENTFLNTRECVKYGDKEFLEGGAFEIPKVAGVRSLNGSNITLNTKFIRNGDIPPYFNPLGARGEDAILGMQVGGLSVMKIPVYTFHDPFQKYRNITKKQYPDSIEAIKVIPGTIDRFCKACIGWIRYAPFLIRLTSHDEREYKSRIDSMREPLKELGQQIDLQLGWNGFRQMAKTLDEFHKHSSKDVSDLNKAKEAWYEIVSRN